MKVLIKRANRSCYHGKVGTVVRKMKANKYSGECEALVVYVEGFYESAIVTEYSEVK